MNPLYSDKNVKHNKKRDFPRLNVKESQKPEASPFAKQKDVLHPVDRDVLHVKHGDHLLQTSSTCFPSSNKKVFSYSDSSRAQNGPNLKDGRKRSLTSPTPNKRNHVKTLSESFINLIMVDGKKSKAEKIFSQTLKNLTQHLENHVEREKKNKREITLFARKENGSLLILGDLIGNRNVHHLIEKAINNVKPTLQVRKVRVARSIYQVPFIMRKKRQERSAIRWIIESAKKKSGHSGFTFSECLAQTVLEAFMGQGQVKEKRDQLHRTAEANRTYLRYRWW